MAMASWRVATEQALYGADGFYLRAGTGTGPAAHFRTSVHASPLFAGALLRLARLCGLDCVVDVGSGRGELLMALRQLDPTLTLVGVEVAARPAHLPLEITWTTEVPPVSNALLVANEWLDNVPVDIVTSTPDGVRLVLVDPDTGHEELGPAAPPADEAWLATWWPLSQLGHRAEVGRPRDTAWSSAIATLSSGVAVAIDYSHARAGRPAEGSLAAFRGGLAVRPVPDGSCDITAAVALDACAAAGLAAGARQTVLTTQRAALRALGYDAQLPAYELSSLDPRAYREQLVRSSDVGELIGAGGLGDFGWLIQTVSADLPAQLIEQLGQLEEQPGTERAGVGGDGLGQ